MGSNDFKTCNCEGIRNCNYIQEIFIKKYQQQIDEVLVLATGKAIEFNRSASKDNVDSYKLGLQETLEKIKEKEELSFNYKVMEVSKGYTEDKLWQLFNSLVEEVAMGDEIYLDLTCATNYQSLLIMNALNYLKVLKDIKINSIEFALALMDDLEVQQKLDKLPKTGLGPSFLDLTALNYLDEWTKAVDNFCTTGSFKELEEIFSVDQERLAVITEDKDNFFQDLEQLLKVLKDFDLKLKSCRGRELNDAALSVAKQLAKFDDKFNLNNQQLLPYIRLLSKLKFKLNGLAMNNGTELQNYFQILDWCLEHNFIQQGWTLLTENLVTIVSKEIGYNHNDEEVREDIKETLKYLHKKFQAWREGYQLTPVGIMNDREVFEQVLAVVDKKYPDFPRLYSKFLKSKQDIDRLGMKRNSEDAQGLKKYLGEYIEDVKKIISKDLKRLQKK